MYLSRGLGAATPGASSLVQGIAAAIQQMEGWFPGSRSYLNNNPGNLRSGPGMTGTAGGYAVFPDVATGQAALDAQVQSNIDRGLTLQQFFAGGNGYPGYAPSADNNNPTAYANFVAGQVGIDTSTPLNSVGGASVAAGIDSIAPSDSSPLPDSSSSGIDLSALTDSSTGISPVVWAAIGVGVAGLLVWSFA